MKNTIKYIIIGFLTIHISACEDWLDRKPTEILLDEQVWSDPEMARSFLANLYNRLQPIGGLDGTEFIYLVDTEEAMWSGGLGGYQQRNNRVNYPYNWRNYWDYGLVRDVNIFLENVETSNNFTAEEQEQLLAEGRFIRAYTYFLFVRSMGGVPLILKSYTYEGPEDVENMQVPRSTEEEIYDFIGQELDEIKESLGNAESKTRANKWTALALKSRAMLYAGSIAKYNNLMPNPITTPGGEVGIPASKADDYYQQSLAASKEIINEGPFSLYNSNPDKGQNFYEALTNKAPNPEVIWAYDFTLDGKHHQYTRWEVPRSLMGPNLGGSSSTPSLNLVEAYEYLDGSSGELDIRTADDSDYIYYDNLEDIFANKDPRLWGTVIYPGSEFRGEEVSIQRGVLEWTGSNYVKRQNNLLGSTFRDGGLLVGADGPLPNAGFVTNTGFYVRKYLDPKPGSELSTQGSDIWWVRFRLGEIMLNAAEAAFELGLPEALNYINQVRERAGFGTNSKSSLTIDDIRHERQVELALEEHRWWDIKRWRIAHEIYDGQANSPTTEVWALYPYRVYNPDDPSKHNKYVFVKQVAPRWNRPRFFRMGNYYAIIPQNAQNANPMLVKNPFH